MGEPGAMVEILGSWFDIGRRWNCERYCWTDAAYAVFICPNKSLKIREGLLRAVVFSSGIVCSEFAGRVSMSL